MALHAKIIALATVLALTACGGEQPAGNSSTSAVSADVAVNPSNTNSVAESNSNPAWQTLNIGTEANFPPLRYVNENQEVTGSMLTSLGLRLKLLNSTLNLWLLATSKN